MFGPSREVPACVLCPSEARQGVGEGKGRRGEGEAAGEAITLGFRGRMCCLALVPQRRAAEAPCPLISAAAAQRPGFDLDSSHPVFHKFSPSFSLPLSLFLSDSFILAMFL